MHFPVVENTYFPYIEIRFKIIVENMYFPEVENRLSLFLNKHWKYIIYRL